ncbi:tetraspanin-18-like [Lineus longissimus]|uniref:tetraspanin-18-like n=1 Tax=Lineus longissimus TaxID=88925 RepID=UPI002B4CC314
MVCSICCCCCCCDCCTLKGIAKWILIAFNVGFFIAGAVLLGVGIWIAVDPSTLADFLSAFNYGSLNVTGLLLGSAYTLIGIGAFIFLIGFTGFCGACKENKVCLIIYIICVSIVLLVQIIAMILVAVFFEQIKSTALTTLKTAVTDNYDGSWSSSNSISLAFDYTQITFDCCGVDSYTNFQGATNWNTAYNYGGSSYTMTIPQSCCKQDDSQFPTGTVSLTDGLCPVTPTTTNSYYTTSCYDSIINYINTYAILLITIICCIVGIEIVGILCAVYICKNS